MPGYQALPAHTSSLVTCTSTLRLPSPLPDVAAAATHTALHRQEPLASLANDRHRHRLSCPVAPPLAYRNGNEAHGQAGPKSCGAPFTKGTRTNNR